MGAGIKMRIIQVKHRIGNLSLDKNGFEIDRERAILPAVVCGRKRSGKDLITVVGTGWWKWGVRITIHWRVR